MKWRDLIKLGVEDIPDSKRYTHVGWFLTHRPLQWCLWALVAVPFFTLVAISENGAVRAAKRADEHRTGV